MASDGIVSYNDIVKNTLPLGPAPTRPPAEPPAELLDPARRRLLGVVAGFGGGSGATVADLVAAVGGHPNTTRHHLRALMSAGLVRADQPPPSGGRGRPATRYAATRAGREADSAGHGAAAAEEYVALAGAFAQRLAERDGDPGADARAIGRTWGGGLAASHADAGGHGNDGSAEERVLGLLDRLGFSPAAEPHESGSGTTVLLRTCPLLDAAKRHPDVVCQVHLGLVTGALEAFDAPADDVGLVPFARPGACVLWLPGTLVG